MVPKRPSVDPCGVPRREDYCSFPRYLPAASDELHMLPALSWDEPRWSDGAPALHQDTEGLWQLWMVA